MENNKKLTVLVVDDSVLFRSQIQLALKDVPFVEVIGTAGNGQIALNKIVEFKPDVAILDVEMPVLDGLSTVRELKRLNSKTKTFLFTSVGKSSIEKTMEALSMGAIDFIPKPKSDLKSGLSPANLICDALKPRLEALWNEIKPSTKPTVHKKEDALNTKNKKHGDIIWETFRPEVLVIASSTGGPMALEELFKHLTMELPYPILIAQHMPPHFTKSLAERVGKVCGKFAKEAEDGELLKDNCIYVAPGDYHLTVKGSRSNLLASLNQNPARNSVRPAADFLFESAAEIFRHNTLSVVLTGMGRDGADGASAIKKVQGAVCIQDKASCVVFGMPGAVYDEGNFDYIGDLISLAQKIKSLSRHPRKKNVA